MARKRSKLKSLSGGNSSKRRRLDLPAELTLALLPTATTLIVLGLVEVLSRQRLLFASLASSSFLIYLAPQHGTNAIRTLATSHMMAALIGFLTYLVLGPGYWSAGSALIVTIVLMILLDIIHPPAVSTSLSFALRSSNENSLILFVLALGITVILVIMERAALWIIARYSRRR
jgi:CBS-domain-containing membrane protein